MSNDPAAHQNEAYRMELSTRPRQRSRPEEAMDYISQRSISQIY